MNAEMNVDELAAVLMNEPDHNKRMEIFRRFMDERDQTRYAKPVNPNPVYARIAGTPPPKKPPSKQEKVEDLYVKPTHRCSICGALLNYEHTTEHVEWHEQERERLLAIAVELLGVLGSLNDG